MGENDDRDRFSAWGAAPAPVAGEKADESTDEKPTDEGASEKKNGVAAALANIRTISVDVLLLITFVVAIGIAFKEFRSNAVVLDPIEVTDELKKLGFTPNVVAQQLADKIAEIQRSAEEGQKHKALFETSWTQTEIQIPGSKISLTTVVRYLKREWGQDNGHISGEITRRGDQLVLALRATSEQFSAPSETKAAITAPLDQLLQPAALNVLHTIKPCLLAAYWYGKETQTRQYVKTLDAIKYCIATAKDEDLSIGYSTWGDILLERRDLAQAYAMYRRAAGTPCKYASPCASMGDVLSQAGHKTEALEVFSGAIPLDPTLSAAYIYRARVLKDLGRYDDAISDYKKALSVDSETGWAIWAYVELGETMSTIGHDEEATGYYNDAGAFAQKWLFRLPPSTDYKHVDVSNAGILQGWCRALRSLEQLDKAEVACAHAQEVDSHDSEIYGELMQVLLSKGDVTLANQLCIAALANDRGSEFVNTSCGDIMRKSNQPVVAQHYYASARAIAPADPYNEDNLGNALQDQHLYSEAINHYKNALSMNPNFGDALIDWGNASAKLRRYSDAVTRFRSALSISPHYSHASVALADALDATGRHGEAVDTYKALVNLYVPYSGIYNSQGLAFTKLGLYSRALERYQRAIEMNPANAAALYNWGEALNQIGEFDQAIDLYSKASRLDAYDAGVHLNWGDALWNRSDLKGALKQYQEAIAIDPANFAARRYSGLLLDCLGRYTEALQHFTTALQLPPRDADEYDDRGDLLPDLGRYREAVGKYRQADLISPGGAATHYKWGQALVNIGEYALAIAQYKTAIDLNVSYTDSYIAWGDALQTLGKPEEANVAFKAAAKLPAYTAEDFRRKAIALARYGDYANAYRSFETAITLNPKSTAVLNDWGNALYNSDINAAVEKYQSAVDIYPGNDVYQLNLAYAFEKRAGPADLEKGILHYRMALALNRSNFHASNGLGLALESAGRNKEARRQLGAALSIPVVTARDMSAKGDLLHNLGNFNRALEMYRKAAEVNPHDASTFVSIGNVLLNLDETAEAAEQFRNALSINPQSESARAALETLKPK